MLLSILSTTSFAQDNYYPNDIGCIRENWTLLKEEKRESVQCKKTKNLKLVEGLRVFPKISDSITFKVRYWEGRYEKSLKTIQTYQRDYVNVCTGRITYSAQVKIENSSVLIYDLANPNLDPEISESYKLAPMTNAEAQEAWEHLKTECETVSAEDN